VIADSRSLLTLSRTPWRLREAKHNRSIFQYRLRRVRKKTTPALDFAEMIGKRCTVDDGAAARARWAATWSLGRLGCHPARSASGRRRSSTARRRLAQLAPISSRMQRGMCRRRLAFLAARPRPRPRVEEESLRQGVRGMADVTMGVCTLSNHVGLLLPWPALPAHFLVHFAVLLSRCRR
jgi:hypothetical protein